MEKQAKTKKKFKSSTELTVFIAYVVLVILFSFIAPYFLTFSNIMNIFLYSAVMGICAAGVTMVIISGGLDISIGSVVALSGMVASLSLDATKSPFLAVILALLTGAACGAINGVLITRLKIMPMIATLATMSIFRGTALLTTKGQSKLVTVDSFKVIGRGYIGGVVPWCVVIMLLLFLIVGYMLKYTPFGRKIYAIGGNEEASRLAGINVKNIRFVLYVICGVCASLSGIITTSQTGTAIPSSSSGLEMDAIGASVLGGISMDGGKGSVVGALLGVLIFSTLQNGLTLMNVMSFWQTIIKGIVLIIAVILDVARSGGYKK